MIGANYLLVVLFPPVQGDRPLRLSSASLARGVWLLTPVTNINSHKADNSVDNYEY